MFGNLFLLGGDSDFLRVRSDVVHGRYGDLCVGLDALRYDSDLLSRDSDLLWVDLEALPGASSALHSGLDALRLYSDALSTGSDGQSYDLAALRFGLQHLRRDLAWRFGMFASLPFDQDHERRRSNML